MLRHPRRTLHEQGGKLVVTHEGEQELVHPVRHLGRRVHEVVLEERPPGTRYLGVVVVQQRTPFSPGVRVQGRGKEGDHRTRGEDRDSVKTPLSREKDFSTVVEGLGPVESSKVEEGPETNSPGPPPSLHRDLHFRCGVSARDERVCDR